VVAGLLVGLAAYGLILLFFQRKPASRSPASLPTPIPGWLSGSGLIDQQLQLGIGYQLGELGAYRAESYQLVAFAAVVAAATTALKIPSVSPYAIASLAIFVAIVLYDAMAVASGFAAPRSLDPLALERQFAVVGAENTAKGLEAPTDADLTQAVKQAHHQAYADNSRSIVRRRAALLRMRLLLALAVLTFVAAALFGTGTASSTPATAGHSNSRAKKQ
jgi:hypothetical protein